jgi:hypothetical protein
MHAGRQDLLAVQLGYLIGDRQNVRSEGACLIRYSDLSGRVPCATRHPMGKHPFEY